MITYQYSSYLSGNIPTDYSVITVNEPDDIWLSCLYTHDAVLGVYMDSMYDINMRKMLNHDNNRDDPYDPYIHTAGSPHHTAESLHHIQSLHTAESPHSVQSPHNVLDQEGPYQKGYEAQQDPHQRGPHQEGQEGNPLQGTEGNRQHSNRQLDQEGQQGPYQGIQEGPPQEKRSYQSKPEEVHPYQIAKHLIEKGYRGQGIKVAVFDSGLADNHPHFTSYHRFDYTDENTLSDPVGHGTFVAGVIAGLSNECPGMAPDVDLYIFRVFTKNQRTYTSWFMDAFNLAMYLGIDVLNLSVGGMDHADIPFMSKIDELAASGVIIVSAIGNDGPLWGTAHNPADQSSVIGVGGYLRDDKVSHFSSRGMTLWEVPYGTGRVKPDILAPSSRVVSLQHVPPYGCRTLSGTSVANPIVTGAIALLLSASENGEEVSNVAAMKQILISSSRSLSSSSIFEQGAGVIDIGAAYDVMRKFVPHVTLWPNRISNYAIDCPVLWPYCAHSMFSTAQPLLFNLTILNSHGNIGSVVGLRWEEKSGAGHGVDEVHLPGYSRGDNVIHRRVTLRGPVFMVRVEASRLIYPWSGHVGVAISVNPSASTFEGDVSGHLHVVVSTGDIRDEASIAVDLQVIRPPVREKRVLWDIFHSMSYPSPFVPNDDLDDIRSKMDLYGDHPFTNYRDTLSALREMNFVVEILRGPWTCFDANNYGILIIADTEETIAEKEAIKLENDVRYKSLSVLVIGDWYDEVSLMRGFIYDDSTHSTWYPITGGANIPSLNKFLRRFGISFGLQSFNGLFRVGYQNHEVQFKYGNTISRFPAGGYLIHSAAGELFPLNGGGLRGPFRNTQPVVGMIQLGEDETDSSGRIVVYGDSSIVDSSVPTGSGENYLLELMVYFLRDGIIPVEAIEVDEPYNDMRIMLPYSSREVVDMDDLNRDILARDTEHKRFSKFGALEDKYSFEDMCTLLL